MPDSRLADLVADLLFDNAVYGVNKLADIQADLIFDNSPTTVAVSKITDYVGDIVFENYSTAIGTHSQLSDLTADILFNNIAGSAFDSKLSNLIADILFDNAAGGLNRLTDIESDILYDNTALSVNRLTDIVADVIFNNLFTNVGINSNVSDIVADLIIDRIGNFKVADFSTDFIIGTALTSTEEGLRQVIALTGNDLSGLGKDLAFNSVNVQQGYATLTIYPPLEYTGHQNVSVKLELTVQNDQYVTIWLHSRDKPRTTGTKIVDNLRLVRRITQHKITFPTYLYDFDDLKGDEPVLTVEVNGSITLFGGQVDIIFNSPFPPDKENIYANLYLDLIYKDHPLAGWVPKNSIDQEVIQENIERIRNYYGNRLNIEDV